jgi:aryl-alcohol dehydrogenase-like predicted oxidoreductase
VPASPGDARAAGRLQARCKLAVSRLTLGALQFGGERGRQDDSDSIRTVHAALDAGISVIDTADSYGAGHSEAVLGEALGKRRHAVLLATKFDMPRGRALQPGDIRNALMESLQRLRTDYVDLYQVHNMPAQATANPLLFDEMEALRAEGLVHALGMTAGPGEGHGAECLEAVNTGHVDAIQAAYHLASQALAESVFPFCVSRGVAVFAREPLAQGLLTDLIETPAALRMGRRARMTDAAFDQDVAKARAFDALRAPGESRAEFALRFALSNKHVDSVVCGMRSAEEVASNVRALERGPLPADVLAKIADMAHTA